MEKSQPVASLEGPGGNLSLDPNFQNDHQKSDSDLVLADFSTSTGSTSSHVLTPDRVKESLLALDQFANAINKSGFKMLGFAEILIHLSPALGATGALFRLVAIVLPKPDSKELKAIKALRDTMTFRFDNLDNKLDKILYQLKIGKYEEKQDILREVRLKYDQFLRAPDNDSLEELKKIGLKNDPSLVLDWLYRKNAEQGLLNDMVQYLEFDKKSILENFEMILMDAVEAAYLRQVCLGVMYPENDGIRLDNQREADKKIWDIFNHMKKILSSSLLYSFNQPVDIFEPHQATSTFLDHQLEKDILSQLKINQSLSNADLAKTLKNFLDQKYDMITWGVHVFNTIKNGKDYEISGFYKELLDCKKRHVVINFGNKTPVDLKKLENLRKLFQKKEKTNFFFSAEKSTSKLDFDAENVLRNLKKCQELENHKMILIVKVKEKEKSPLGAIFKKKDENGVSCEFEGNNTIMGRIGGEVENLSYNDDEDLMCAPLYDVIVVF